MNSFFLFENYEDCEYYIKNHKGGGEICEVELIQTRKLFKADMNLLDEIPNFYTYKEVNNVVNKYWKQELSRKPVFEILFQGKCILKPIK